MPLNLQCACGEADWLACYPGTAAEERVQANVCLLYPTPEVPMRVQCRACLRRDGWLSTETAGESVEQQKSQSGAAD